jgi:hypothetical protein
VRYLVTAIVLASTLLLSLSAQCHQNHFRVGGSFVRLTAGSQREALGNGWGVGGEYSFTDALTPDEQIGGGDVAIAVSYRRFDHSTSGTDSLVDYTSFGMRWRGGAGAGPDTEGWYGGVGVAAAMLRIQNTTGPSQRSDSAVKLECSIFGGANFARNAYAEIVYANVPQVQAAWLSNAMITVGVRF